MKRLRLGIASDEFFEPSLGRLGGFGWATRRVARLFTDEPELGIDVVLITNELTAREGRLELPLHGTRLLLRDPGRLAFLRRLRKERLDLVLTIDYNSGFRFLMRALPRTPFIVWARDPCATEDLAVIETLRVPGDPARPQGVAPLQDLDLSGTLRWSRWLRRDIRFAVPSPHLATKLPDALNVTDAAATHLPNIIDVAAPAPRAERPRVLFLARLDPRKRPWLFVELARRLPDVEFAMAGQAHFRGPGAFALSDAPPNLRVLGHVDGARKAEWLSSAWLLVNTSIHEGLAVSFLEALACAVPIVSTVDPDSLVSRFGECVGRFPGDGLDGVPPLSGAVTRLLDSPAERVRLGEAGRAWVRATHNRQRFLEAFFALVQAVGLPRPGAPR